MSDLDSSNAAQAHQETRRVSFQAFTGTINNSFRSRKQQRTRRYAHSTRTTSIESNNSTSSTSASSSIKFSFSGGRRMNNGKAKSISHVPPSGNHHRGKSGLSFAGIRKFGWSAATSHGSAETTDTATAAAAVRDVEKKRAAYRRYRVGESVLVECPQSRYASLVNRYGYPDGGGELPEEMRGPYVYVLATVKLVHFDEVTEYYTVTRADTSADERADPDYMEPIRSTKAEAAALLAATHSLTGSSSAYIAQDMSHDSNQGGERTDKSTFHCLEVTLIVIVTPFIWLCEHLAERLARGGKELLAMSRKDAKLFLNGKHPCYCTASITAVNILVCCSCYYLLIDVARISFANSSADSSLSIVSFIIWLILVLELCSEVFIRPEGYDSLVVSEKAFHPLTVRYINKFHLVLEILALIFFIPEFVCLFIARECSDRGSISILNASILSILGPTALETFKGRLIFAVTRFRVVGLVRHWKKMLIMNSFENLEWKFSKGFLPVRENGSESSVKGHSMKNDSNKASKASREPDESSKKKDEALVNATNIETALLVVNSHRAMAMFWVIFGLYPLIFCAEKDGGANTISYNMVQQLQANNLALRNQSTKEACTFWIRDTILPWTVGMTVGQPPGIMPDTGIYLLYLKILPLRCTEYFPRELNQSDGVLTSAVCELNFTNTSNTYVDNLCGVWSDTTSTTSDNELATRAGIRVGAITTENVSDIANLTDSEGKTAPIQFSVEAKFNNTYTVQPAALTSFLLQLSILFCILTFISTYRRDTNFLVLPLRRMLKIVAQYAKNPLADIKEKPYEEDDNEDDLSEEETVSEVGDDTDKFGRYETEQLISAVSKITDLLRKCWGVAGSGIISTNLARQEGGSLTEVFNPTVPGKSVYALFGFCAVNEFDNFLRSLEGDVLILINDVAKVLHEEVFRWGYGESGQCNKNLGSAFLMVYRIGHVKDVIKKLDEATHVVFTTSKLKKTPQSRKGKPLRTRIRKKSLKSSKKVNPMSLSLASLPGIQGFTDRALLGMLKAFAGIHRDEKLLRWKDDFRLGAGVGAFSVNMIFGMDAGWAVEGAVGSEYKIDATYLSPHVNMASRMMSACKQYGVSILVSQSVEELMSDIARSKLRHLDTVTVKGSSVRQRIYTYDARHKGVDFFLYSRSDDQANSEADHYTPNTWNTDQDLTAMRQHVTDDFLDEFNKGRDQYLEGHWTSAIKHLERANEIMVENVVEGGYMTEELNQLSDAGSPGDVGVVEEELRKETEDGPSRRLLAYMRAGGGIAPSDWQGYHPLTSK